MTADRNGLALETPDVVLARKLGQGPVALAGEEPPTYDPVRQVKERQPLRGSGRLAVLLGMAAAGQTFQPGKAQRGAPGGGKKVASGSVFMITVVVESHVLAVLR